MDVLVDDHAGGTATRRLLPVVIVVPVLLGWLRLKGQRAGLYDTATGTLLFTCSVVVSLAVLVWWSGRSFSRADEERRRAEQEAARQRDTLAPARRRHAPDRLVGAPRRLDRLLQPALVRLHGRGTGARPGAPVAGGAAPRRPAGLRWSGGGRPSRTGEGYEAAAPLPARLRRRVPLAPGRAPCPSATRAARSRSGTAPARTSRTRRRRRRRPSGPTAPRASSWPT